MTEKQKNAEQIAGEILRLSRNMLLVNLRFLDAALNQLELRPVAASSLLTDGEHLCYRPEWVIKRFLRTSDKLYNLFQIFRPSFGAKASLQEFSLLTFHK